MTLILAHTKKPSNIDEKVVLSFCFFYANLLRNKTKCNFPTDTVNFLKLVKRFCFNS